jgi:hypothetical protein
MSVACAAALFAVGCLDDAPEYPPRTQIPPFIIDAQVTPTLAEVYEDGIPMNINVPFRSEDENENLTALFFVDLLPGDGDFLFEQQIPIEASTYDDISRSVSYEWRNERDLRGCHSLTLVLTYDGNISGNLPSDETRTARRVWWLALEDEGTVLLRTCPRSN